MKAAIENNKKAVEAITDMWKHTETIDGCRFVEFFLQHAIIEAADIAPKQEIDDIFSIRDLCMAKCHFMICAEKKETQKKDFIYTGEIKPSDLQVDTYSRKRKSGFAFIQEEGVRLNHIPTGVIVLCDKERSQHKNRATAMKMLKERLEEYRHE